MEKLEIIINEMMADCGPVPMDLGNVSGHDTKSRQGDSDTMSYEDVCAIAWKGYKAGKGAGKKVPNGSGTWHRGKGADEWTSGKRDDGAKRGGKKGFNGSKPDWHSDKDKGSKGKGKGKRKGKSETRCCHECGEQGHIGVNCPYKWANSIDEEDDHRGRASLKERTLKNWRAWRRLTKKENSAGLRRAESPGGEGELTHDQHSTTSQKTMKVSKRPED